MSEIVFKMTRTDFEVNLFCVHNSNYIDLLNPILIYIFFYELLNKHKVELISEIKVLSLKYLTAEL